MITLKLLLRSSFEKRIGPPLTLCNKANDTGSTLKKKKKKIFYKVEKKKCLGH